MKIYSVGNNEGQFLYKISVSDADDGSGDGILNAELTEKMGDALCWAEEDTARKVVDLFNDRPEIGTKFAVIETQVSVK